MSNIQPSLVLTQAYNPNGIFPSEGNFCCAEGATLGFVYSFAGDFAPGGSFLAQGQVLPISSNIPSFSVIGTTYGGNGVTNFALPNLTGAAVIGANPGGQGAASGSNAITFSKNQIPGHGATQPFDNRQPSLTLMPLIAISGVFPSEGGSEGSAAFIGQVANFAGTFVPSGWMVANGQLLSIAQNTALFSVIGTTYGGNGVTTFALPNLVGSVSVGADAAHPLGSTYGQTLTTLTAAQLPVGATPGAPVNNDQPSLALNYIIATAGLFPPEDGGQGFDPNIPTLGEVTAFAGNFAPSGWAFTDGQLLPIAGNTALFSLLGTQYGGDGVTDFALPDLDGRTIIGSGGAYAVGEAIGADTFQLTGANLPMAPVPEPATWTILIMGVFSAGAALRGRRRMVA